MPKDQAQLVVVDPRVVFWPAAWMKDLGYSSAVPVEWWISFSRSSSGIMWCMRYPEYSRVVYVE